MSVPQSRASATRILGEPDKVLITIDHIQYKITVEEFQHFCRDCLNILQSLLGTRTKP